MPIQNPKLEKIHIKTIKGIKDKTFELNLYPNKPSILVAPNGFGKSSFATAFLSFNNKRLDISDENEYQGTIFEPPLIEVFHNGVKYIIDKSNNTMSNKIATFVINSSIYAKGKSQYIGEIMINNAFLAIEDITLVNKIPEKLLITYSITKNRKIFGKNGKVLPNIEYLLNNHDLFNAIKDIDISQFKKKKTYGNLVNDIINKINNYNGNIEQIKEYIQENLLENFDKIKCLNDLYMIIKNYSIHNDIVLNYLETIQVVEIFCDINYKKYLEWQLYKYKKAEFNTLIKNFNTTGLSIKAKEVQKKDHKKLILSFPNASRVSNGERDILVFIAKLFKAQAVLQKDNNILIIDEIFDYLDDANLITFQYYITNFIENYKNKGKNLYCILLTHLDPEYMNNFCFGQHKLQIRYLMNLGTTNQSEILSLIKKRTIDESVKADISHYLLHYEYDEKIVEGYCNRSFYETMYNEVKNKYLKDHKYDSLKVCLATRIKIEENIYNKLITQELKSQFIKKHKTKEKLNFAANNGIEIPEIYFLLGIIYNDNLHWKENRDYDTPLRTKLSNLVIKNMIKSIFEEGA